jgi:hypothetical protein
MVFALWWVMAPIAAIAESSIAGTVTDQTGAAMPNVHLIAIHVATRVSRDARTDDTGHFQFADLPIGVYTLRCEKQGFQSVEIQDVSLSINHTLEEPIEMRIASDSQEVEVRSQPDALATDATTGSVTLGGERIDDLPTQKRNLLNFVLLAPGVAPAARSNTLRTTAAMKSPNEDSGFTFGGMRARNNGLYIDGLDNRDEMTGGNRVAVSPDMVQEFQVSGSDVAPASGGAAGANVNVVTLSGTNQWHGDASFFAGNGATNAREPDVESAIRPRYKLYTPEGSLGGPLSKNRTFVYSTLEMERESTEDSSEISEEDDLSQINAVLASHAFARSGVHQIAGSLFPSRSAATMVFTKLDHQLTDADHLFGRYGFSRGTESNDVLGTDNFADQSARGSSVTQDQSVAAGWAHSPNTGYVSEFRLQYSHRDIGFTPNSRGPLIEIPGVISFGDAPQLDNHTSQDYYQLTESLTFVRRKHQISVGGSGQHIRFANETLDRFAGIFVFPTISDFVRGTPDVYIQRFGSPSTKYSTTPVGFWIQDQWQPGGGITIIGGIRYDAQRLPTPVPSATNNWSPRLGIAWHPGSRGWVVRGSAGLFYDRYPFAFLNDAIQMDGVHGFEQYAVGSLAAQAFALSQGGSLVTPMAGIAYTNYRAASNFPSTYARHVTAGVERRIDGDTTVSVEYLNVHGNHMPQITNVGGSVPPAYELEQESNSAYQGVTVTLNRRISHEMTYLVGYTESRAYDSASDFNEQPLDPRNRRLDWSRSDQFQAHRLMANGIFELPFGDMLSAPVWLRRLSHEFEFGPILTYGSPQPINPLLTTDFYRTGAYPISARPAGLARDAFSNRSTFSVDLRVRKGFVLAHDKGLFSIGVDGYNLTNHLNRLRVSPFYSTGTATLASFGGVIESLDARRFQFTVEWEF